MPDDETRATPLQPWKISTNDRYNKIVARVISVATGSLLLPALFLREFLAVPKQTPLAPYLNCWAYIAWFSLAISIALGLVYSWLSVKWVKGAWGQPTVSEKTLEPWMDVSYVLMMVLFLAGVGSIVKFFVTFLVTS